MHKRCLDLTLLNFHMLTVMFCTYFPALVSQCPQHAAVEL